MYYARQEILVFGESLDFELFQNYIPKACSGAEGSMTVIIDLTSNSFMVTTLKE